VFDYGVAGENGFNKISFLEKEQQIFVVGSKPGGEFEKTYDVIKNNFYNNVFYIYNFVAEGEQEDIKELMGLDDDYEVLFCQGGASMQFTMIPQNFAVDGKVGNYVLSGSFATKAYDEAKLLNRSSF